MADPPGLEDIGYGRGKLLSSPAQSIRRLDVLLGGPVDINRAYASYDEQMDKYIAYRAYVVGRGPWAPLALHPDKSWHCKGLAVDSDDGPGMRGARLTREQWKEHGWLFEVPSELWHGQYYTSLDTHYGETAGSGAIPFPTPGDPANGATPDAPNGEEMILITAPDRRPALVGTGYFRDISSANGSEFLNIAAQLADRRIDFDTARKYDVAKALLVQGQIPPHA